MHAVSVASAARRKFAQRNPTSYKVLLIVDEPVVYPVIDPTSSINDRDEYVLCCLCFLECQNASDNLSLPLRWFHPSTQAMKSSNAPVHRGLAVNRESIVES